MVAALEPADLVFYFSAGIPRRDGLISVVQTEALYSMLYHFQWAELAREVAALEQDYLVLAADFLGMY